MNTCLLSLQCSEGWEDLQGPQKVKDRGENISSAKSPNMVCFQLDFVIGG